MADFVCDVKQFKLCAYLTFLMMMKSELKKALNTTFHLFLTHESDHNHLVFGHTGQRQR